MALASIHLLTRAAASGPPFSVVFTGWLPMMAAPSTSSGGTGLPAPGLPQHRVEPVLGPLPASLPAPGAEVMEDDAPRRQVMGQHPPRATAAKYAADGVDRLPAGILERPAARSGRRQQGFQPLPFPAAEAAGIGCSVHLPTPQPSFQSLLSCQYTNYDLWGHPHSPQSPCISPKFR